MAKMNAPQNPEIELRIHWMEQEMPAEKLHELKRMWCRAALRAVLGQMKQDQKTDNVNSLDIL
jgi:hypothetical protein